MNSFLQKIFIAILNPVYTVTGRLGDRGRLMIIHAICFIFSVFFLLLYSGACHLNYDTMNLQGIIGTILLILLIIVSIDRPLEEIPWRRMIVVPMVLSGIGIVITGMMHTVGNGFIIFGLQLIVVFPCLAFVWINRGDYETLFEAFARAMCLLNIIYFLFSVAQACSGQFGMIAGRWTGTMYNVNLLGQFGANSFLAALFMTLRRKETASRILYLCVAGIGMGFTFLSICRGAMFVCVGGIITLIVYTIVRRKKIEWGVTKENLAKQGAFLIAFFVLFGAVFMGIPQIQQHVDKDYDAVIDVPAEITYKDRFGTEKYTDANRFTSGRVDHWKVYIRHLTLFGNDFDQTDWSEFPTGVRSSAHNLFLGVAYRSGVPVGLLFVFVQIVAGIIAVFLLFDRRINRTCYLFYLLFFVEYFYESSVDVAIMPCHRFTVLLFYIGLICIMPKKADGVSIGRHH